MLTSSELKQIKDYLALYGKKDSQLSPAVLPLNVDDKVVILQGGANKLVTISELAQTLEGEVTYDICTMTDYENLSEKILGKLYICTYDDTHVLPNGVTGNPEDYVKQIYLDNKAFLHEDTKFIYDEEQKKYQKEINQEVQNTLESIENNKADKSDTYTKTEVDNIEEDINTRLQIVEELAEISIGGGDIGIGTAADFESDDPSDLAKVPTIGAVLGSMDDEPTAGSDSLVKSGGILNKILNYYNKLFDLFINDASCRETVEDGLFITDENGYAIINLLDTNNYSPVEIKETRGNNLVICDEQGNVYIDFTKGIKTKTWNGNYLYPSTSINKGTTDLTGCINKAFDMIHIKWPTAQVFVCSIMKMGRTMADATWSYLRHNDDDLSYNQYNKRIKECAELAGFTFIDLWGEMSIDPLNTTQAPIYFHNAQEIEERGVDPARINDRLHPIQAGHERIAKIIYNHIINANGGDSWQGKKAIFFGDSITDNYNAQHTDKVYYSYLTDWLQLKDDGMNPNGYTTKNTIHYPQNAGAYGTGYMLKWEGQGNLYERIPNYNNDYELVVIMLGVNDFQEPLGEIYNY